jgi:uncharacterized protein (DUF427 family)
MPQTLLEDLVLGPGASPGLTEGFRWEPSPRRVRVVFNDTTIADSHRVMLLHEAGRLPVFYFPFDDVRQDLLEGTEHHTASPLKGEARYWSVRVGDRLAENAAWSYSDPPAHGPAVAGYIAFYWSKMDAWYEEDERAFAHARDPYKLVDVRHSSRHVRVVLGGETIADTRRPLLLFETGLPVRYYIPEQDVRMDLLEPTASASQCAYKGQASYWSARIGDRTYQDITWTYREPLALVAPIANLVSFYNERVDAIYVDDELVATPHTQWSD